MKRLMLGLVVTLFVMALAVSARGEEAIFKDEPKKDEPAAKAPAAGDKAAATGDKAATPAETKSELPAKVLKAIEDTVAKAEQLLQASQAELAKEEAKRNVTKAQEQKLLAANMYVRAAMQAKAAIAALKEDQRAGLSDQYDKPNRQKAIDIYMELAQAAVDKKDYNRAKSLYLQVLKIDPENTAAKEALKKLEADMKAAAKEKASGSKGGGDTKNTYDPSKTDHSQTGRTPTSDYKHTGRSY
jgi:tetratricopeptide (TPR) repeat protein